MASFAIDHSRIPARRPAGTAVHLRGTGTAWDGSTTFGVSGVAGCSILTTIVNDGTDATLVIATGTAVGTLTVSDSVNSATLAVANYRPHRWAFYD